MRCATVSTPRAISYLIVDCGCDPGYYNFDSLSFRVFSVFRGSAQSFRILSFGQTKQCSQCRHFGAFEFVFVLCDVHVPYFVDWGRVECCDARNAGRFTECQTVVVVLVAAVMRVF